MILALSLVLRLVVPYVGTWIEMREEMKSMSLHPVVPYVGTWIEIFDSQRKEYTLSCRSLRGNVDRNMLCMLIAPTKILSFPTWERG